MASFIAAGTCYSTSNVPMIPFYIYYSMFGFQRVGDLAWAAGDMRTRGFLLGGTSGRTTLNGEGLQHEDGHSHILASTIPNCVTYDPTYAYELAVIIQHGLKRMLTDQDDVFYYITLLNENYAHPAMPEGAEEGILKRHVHAARGSTAKPRASTSSFLARGAILREVIAAADMLANDTACVSARSGASRASPSCAARRSMSSAGICCIRSETPRCRSSRERFSSGKGPVIASTDYMKLFADRSARMCRRVSRARDGRLRTLRLSPALRSFFEVDRYFVTVAALKALADENKFRRSGWPRRSRKYGIDPERPNPARS